MAEAKIKEKKWKKEFEEDIYTNWKKKEPYKFDEKSKLPVYSIDTPPPYVNTPVHIGHATVYVLMDMFARYKRMTGHNVLFPLGLDRNGLPIEMAAEKEFKVRLTEVPREKAVEYCHKILEKATMESVSTFLRTGISFNTWEKGDKIGSVYETDSPRYRGLTQHTFIKMWKKGLIYEDERVNNYCPGCQTTIADAEVVYADLPGKFHDIKFKVKETGEEIIIGTTRPELICTIGMMIYNPEDERYKHLEGKHAISPIFEKEVPIKAHPYADVEKGTGIMMMCSYGDLTDIRFFREQNLPEVVAINKDGKMNEHAGFLKGLTVEEARKKIVEELKKKGLLVKVTPTMHRTPICERSKDPIEFIGMPEFYVKQLEFKDKMYELAKKLKFYDPKSRQILLDWIDSVKIDWPISRRRFYATEIPLWYCKKCGEAVLPPEKPIKYYQPWREKCPVKCKCGSTEFKGETRVFDTWFDSSITPLNIMDWARNKFYDKNKPCTLRPQGKEIVRTWLYYTLLKCYQLTGDCIFKDVWIHHHIIDEKGKKMSKREGNIIDPRDILDKLGAEPFRLWSTIEGNITQTDFRCSFERIEGASKTLTKLWNVARFISMFPKAEKPKQLNELDKWIINEINSIIKFTKEKFESYDFHNPTLKIKHFLWETFASHYIELVKNRAYKNEDSNFSEAESKSAHYTLHFVLEKILELLAPVLPMITHKLYKDLYGEELHLQEFPKAEKKMKIEFDTFDITELNSLIWKAKKDAGKSLRDELTSLTLDKKFEKAEKDLIATHNVKKIKYGKFKVEV